MLDKTETLNEQIQRNTIGHCENKSDPKFDHDYNTDYSRILLPNYNPLKIIQEGRSPHHHHHQQQLLQYLQETHYRQQLQGLRYRHSPPLPSSHCFHSHCCFEQESGPRFVEVKAELRSTEEEEGEEEEEKKKKKQGLFLSPSHKECKRERRDDGERRTLQQQQQRPLLGLHPNTNITGLKRRTPHGHGNVKQQRQTCHSNQQAYKNSDKKMDTEKDVHIKVDDDDDIDIDVAFGEDDNKERMTCKFTNCNDDDDSNNSSINGRSCSISSNSSGSSTNSSICSGDEDDVDSGIDGGHHNNNNNNHNDSNNIELQRKELRIIDLSPTQITSNSATTFKDSLGYKNTRMKQHDDTEYQHQIMSKNNNMRETSLLGECAVYYQHRRTPPDSPPSSQQQGKQLKKLSAIFTNEDTHNPPDLTRKFTNFFIDDILKPEFGKKPFETGTTTIRTVGRKLKFPSSPSSSPPCSSSSFPFSISSLSQSSLLSSSSFSSITSHNSGKKKSFSRYAPSDHSRRRCSPSKSSSVSSQEESPRSLQVESVNKSHTLSSPTSRGTAKKRDLTTTGAPVDPKSNENSTEFQFKYPAWVFCTRYSDRPSSGPRSRKMKRKDKKTDEKRPRTAFTPEQLQRLKREFDHGRYLTEERRQALAKELGLNESQIKIWFQNKRAKMKKVSGAKNPLALQLIAEGLYNHQTNKDSP